MLEVAFCAARSRMRASARSRSPRAREARLHARRSRGVGPIRANSALPGFKRLGAAGAGRDKVRHVGEVIAVVRRGRRAAAEDLAAACGLDFEALPAVHDMLTAPLPGQPLVHEHWGDNVFLETRRDDDVSRARRHAAGKGHADLAHLAPMHGADRGQGRAWPSGTRGSGS